MKDFFLSTAYIILLFLCLNPTNAYLNYGWPPCANNTFTDSGMINLQQMLYDCVDYIPGSLTPPSYYSPEGVSHGPTNVSVQLALNNLVNVNDLTSQITLDFYFRLTWSDPRLFLPDVWQYLNPEVSTDGIDVTQYIRNQNQLNIWLPDLVFTDSNGADVVSEVIKLSRNGTMYWSRHYLMTLIQPQMSFHSFPLDHQNFTLRIQSYSFSNKILRMEFAKKPVDLLYDIQQQQYNIKMNELWTYEQTTAYATSELFPNLLNPFRVFSTGYVNIRFVRQDLGIIYRLSLPVTIFLIIVGLSFWADIDKRIDVTLQMLLVVAALYLIVGQVIPFVGYLTTMDMFITVTFVLLSITVGIHFLTLVLDRKKDKYPLNAFYRDLLVYFFKAVWIPAAFILFVVMFEIDIAGILFAMYSACVAATIDAVLHIPYLKRSFKVSILNLRLKVSHINHGNIIHKILTATRAGTGDKEEEEEVKFGKDVRLTWVEKLVYEKTKDFYPDEPRGFDKKTGKVEPPLEDNSGDNDNQNTGKAAEYSNKIRALSMAVGGVNSAASGATAANGDIANPMRFSVSDVYDSDDEEERQGGVEMSTMASNSSGSSAAFNSSSNNRHRKSDLNV